VLDPASYIYDDKGKKRESVRVVEVHQDKQRELEKSLEEQKSLNDKNQRKILDQQRQLDSWRAWNDEQTRVQASWGAQYNQPQTVQQDWRQSTQASGGVPQGDNQQYTSTYRCKSGRGRAAHNPGNTQGDAQNSSCSCYNCGKKVITVEVVISLNCHKSPLSTNSQRR